MQNKQRELFNKNRVQQEHPSPESIESQSASDMRAKGGFLDFLENIQGSLTKFLTLLGIVGLLMEMFLPNAFQPSTFFAHRMANLESKKLGGTQRAIADAESLKAFEVGHVQNALAEQQAYLVNELTAQIDRANQCETQKLQLGNQAMMECITQEKGTFTACKVTQAMIANQPCPAMPELSQQTKALVAKYQHLKKGK